MTTTTHNEIIAQARRRYLVANPLRITNVPTTDLNTGAPGETWPIPNLGDMQIIGCKLGMEFLAVCHDDEAVNDWINTALGITGTPELTSILFANVFRGINVVIASMIEGAGAQTRMQQLAVDAWGRDFSGPAPDDEGEE
ncbi:hypothetical protein NJB1604_00110 [Mycobacterium marinum]|uniref:hypothetical protein n=1 Tax=Mycobacterium marinum TaxID=1781 RepID=UPI0021C2C344|nr:hypothetical protein [Mycobacterium marinum]GJO36580.1 hypothetical protein NJB1604_00110 [Mycobacterium marinum]